MPTRCYTSRTQWAAGIAWRAPHGKKPVRYIYIDEAGTSENEPVTVVVGIVINADTQYVPVEKRLAELLNSVPASLRPGFISHAKAIWGNRKFRDGWPKEERVRYLKAMVSIPRALGIPISVAMVRRTNPPDPNGVFSRADFHHGWAFAMCVAHADMYICHHGSPDEVATVVAENVPEKEKLLRATTKYLRKTPFSLPGNADTPYTILRVKDTIHFVAKEDGPLLQIADACAFGFRRFFNEQEIGQELVLEMATERGADLKTWDGFGGSAIFAPHPLIDGRGKR